MSTIAFTSATRTIPTRAAVTRAAVTRTATTCTAATRSAAAPRLRLTRRGRIVFGTLLAGLAAAVLAISAMGAPAMGAPAPAGSTASATSFEHITVAAGESLWDLAAWIAPAADPREVVAALVSLNQLPTTDVQPGQRLAIPLAYSE